VVAMVDYTIMKLKPLPMKRNWIINFMFLFVLILYFKQDGEDPSLVPHQTNGQLNFNITDSVPDGGFSF
jgi:hypothetical protein